MEWNLQYFKYLHKGVNSFNSIGSADIEEKVGHFFMLVKYMEEKLPAEGKCHVLVGAPVDGQVTNSNLSVLKRALSKKIGYDHVSVKFGKTHKSMT